MTNEQPNKAFDRLVHRALVPKGLRPRTSQAVDKMLEALGGQPVSAEKLQRMLRKVNGQEPVFSKPEPDIAPVWSAELTEQERELVALHRAQGKPLPPDLETKLQAMERRAAQPPEEDDGR